MQAVWPWSPYKTDVHPLAQPELDYLAPECGTGESNTAASDMYSLGVVITALYNGGGPLLEANKDWLSYKRNLVEVRSAFMIVFNTYTFQLLVKCHSLQPQLFC